MLGLVMNDISLPSKELKCYITKQNEISKKIGSKGNRKLVGLSELLIACSFEK